MSMKVYYKLIKIVDSNYFTTFDALLFNILNRDSLYYRIQYVFHRVFL